MSAMATKSRRNGICEQKNAVNDSNNRLQRIFLYLQNENHRTYNQSHRPVVEISPFLAAGFSGFRSRDSGYSRQPHPARSAPGMGCMPVHFMPESDGHHRCAVVDEAPAQEGSHRGVLPAFLALCPVMHIQQRSLRTIWHRDNDTSTKRAFADQRLRANGVYPRPGCQSAPCRGFGKSIGRRCGCCRNVHCRQIHPGKSFCLCRRPWFAARLWRSRMGVLGSAARAQHFQHMRAVCQGRCSEPARDGGDRTFQRQARAVCRCRQGGIGPQGGYSDGYRRVGLEKAYVALRLSAGHHTIFRRHARQPFRIRGRAWQQHNNRRQHGEDTVVSERQRHRPQMVRRAAADRPFQCRRLQNILDFKPGTVRAVRQRHDCHVVERRCDKICRRTQFRGFHNGAVRRGCDALVP